ncbi:hypothetical protein DC20_12335 [Rufibacter tibetensis]|uniref:Uncharacterized protein n=1 Tax=Rufibacter tibetensis TaxID=512763 RepID=A0A0P0CQE8_9BACT|nr:hypothetical protein DC20_12335 [Rufibacter tibetensis]
MEKPVQEEFPAAGVCNILSKTRRVSREVKSNSSFTTGFVVSQEGLQIYQLSAVSVNLAIRKKKLSWLTVCAGNRY